MSKARIHLSYSSASSQHAQLGLGLGLAVPGMLQLGHLELVPGRQGQRRRDHRFAQRCCSSCPIDWAGLEHTPAQAPFGGGLQTQGQVHIHQHPPSPAHPTLGWWGVLCTCGSCQSPWVTRGRGLRWQQGVSLVAADNSSGHCKGKREICSANRLAPQNDMFSKIALQEKKKN